MRRRGLLAAALCGLAGFAVGAETITPIRFARGASSARLSGAAERGGRALYSVEAAAGQTMTLTATAVEQNAVFQIYRPGAVLPARPGEDIRGRTLPGAGEGEDTKRWSGVLPESGTYLIVVGATRGGTQYNLDLAIR